MSQVAISGNASGTGTLTIAAPNTNSNYTLTLPAATGTVASIASVNNNGVIYANSSGQPTTSTTFVFDGTNVGIGTSSPSYKLDVSGPATATPVTNGIIRILTTGSNPPTGNGGGLVFSQVDSSAVNRDYASITGSRVNSSANNQVDMVFSTGDPGGGSIPITERMRLTTAGNLLVGTTTNSFSSTNYGIVLNPNSESFWVANTASNLIAFNINTNNNIFKFFRSGTQVGNVNVTTTATAYVTSSDYRLKHDIQPMTGALAKVAALKPCTYKWNVDDSDGEGFIAHELAEVIPQAVSGEKDAVNEDGSIKPQGIDTSFLVATLTAAIKEQQAIIIQLQADVAELKGKQ